MTRTQRFVLLLLAFSFATPAARAQEVGTVASVQGKAEIGHGGSWTAAAIGAPVHLGDELRTQNPGGLRVVFQDDSVLNLSESSHVVVDEQVFNPNEGKARSLFHLLAGKVNALVSEYYHQPGTEYEVKTATAVAGVRGTDFIIEYDPAADVTQVVGISGTVEVHSVLDLLHNGVLVTSYERTSIARGELPTPPQRATEKLFRQYLEGVDFIGAGRAESSLANSPLVAGSTVPAPDRAVTAPEPVQPSAHVAGVGERDASNLTGQPPSVVESMKGNLNVRF